MNEIIIAAIALSAMVWILVVERTEDQGAEIREQLVDSRLSKYGPKVLGATFQRGNFTALWYEDGRMEILRKGALVETLHLIEKDRAEFDFLYQIRNDN